MAFNPFDPALFAVKAPCLPCCTTPPAGCSCALLIPIEAAFPSGFTVTPCADYATASALVSSIQVADCLGYCQWDGVGVFTSFDADNSVANELILTAVGNPDNAPTCQARMWASLALLSGSTLTVNASALGGLSGATSVLYKCDGTQVDLQSGATQTFSVPDDGEYFILCAVTSTVDGFGGGSDTLVADITCDMTMWTNPVIALWDDSGTTRKLWACPKLLLPPLTESTGTWYASCADAHDAMAHDSWTIGFDGPMASNCVGFTELKPPGVGSALFTAIDGGSSLSLEMYSSTNTFGTTYALWGSINAVAGDTISMAWSGWPDGALAWTIYDDTGTAVESGTALSSPAVSSPLPYTGKYTISVTPFLPLGPGSETSDVTVTITSSGAMSVNPIQARYDLGLTCAGTLNCGASCP